MTVPGPNRRPLLMLLLVVTSIAMVRSFSAHAAGARQVADASVSGTPPRLVVILVVDQMRSDYIGRFRRDWTGGLKRLITDGAVFRRAAYPYLTTVTCPGHATIATGAWPRTHGVIQNVWWDREGQSLVDCTADERASVLGYSETHSSAADSANRLLVPTLADELRTRRGGRVVSVSIKAHASAILAGHGGDAVTWLENRSGWATSSAYTATPVATVDAFVRSHPISSDYGKVWTPMLSAARYTDEDDALGEAPPRGWGATFPHALRSAQGTSDEEFMRQWRSSPFANDYVARFAIALTESMRLGRTEGPDVLAVSFSSTDFVGHAFGPRSQEVQDIYAHLDRTIGTLLDDLDRLVGRDCYVLALTADHGVTPLPEQLIAEGDDAGRLSSPRIGAAIEEHLGRELGAQKSKYVSRVVANDVYLAPGMYERLRGMPAAMSSLLNRLSRLEGIARVFQGEQVRQGTTSPDAFLRAAALSYYPGRSGDLILVPRPNWVFAASGATHGTSHPDDQRVPLVLFGRGIKRGEYDDAATPADVAPTLAALCGISLSHADGHVLRMALK
jgi:predicted AlkP superfamily pyrophosphatase or phosphodiesterase